jgi:hypothetical protein
MVTDLDPHLTQRALASLSAELTRREEILAAAGARDIEEYTERAGREPRRQPLPRLVIVIDEFASLARDLPEFVTGLVGIAQRGRSLIRRAAAGLRIPAQPSPWLPPPPQPTTACRTSSSCWTDGKGFTSTLGEVSGGRSRH